MSEMERLEEMKGNIAANIFFTMVCQTADIVDLLGQVDRDYISDTLSKSVQVALDYFEPHYYKLYDFYEQSVASDELTEPQKTVVSGKDKQYSMQIENVLVIASILGAIPSETSIARQLIQVAEQTQRIGIA